MRISASALLGTLLVSLPAAFGQHGPALEGGALFGPPAFVPVVQQAYLKADTAQVGGQFGSSVAADGYSVAASRLGEVFLSVRFDQAWGAQGVVAAANGDPFDDFGYSTSLSGNTLVVGAPGEDSGATGVDGDETDNSSINSGAVYVFVRSGTTWAQQAYLKASGDEVGKAFGYSVSLSGDTLAVGAFSESSSATGVNGNENDTSALAAGAAYVFVRSGTTWSQEAYIKAANTDAGDHFGQNAGALSACFAVVGAPHEDSAATGLDGDDSDDSVGEAGAAYVFDLTDVVWSDQGCALAGVSGLPLLVGTGPLTSGSPNLLSLSNAHPSSAAGLFIAFSSKPTAFKGGTLKPFPFFDPFVLPTSSTGTLDLPFSMPAGIPACTELWIQLAISDPFAIKNVSLSNAILGLTP